MLELSIVVIWVASGVLAYAGTFGYFQHKYAGIAEQYYYKDMIFSAMIGALTIVILGPVGLFVIALLSKGFKYGLKFK